MKQYILPEGFTDRKHYDACALESFNVTVVWPNGHMATYSTNLRLDDVTSGKQPWVGFKFVEPLKVKERYRVLMDSVICDNGTRREYYSVYSLINGDVVEMKINGKEAAEHLKKYYEENTP